MVEREPEWLSEDTEAALEYLAYLSSLCSGCGNPKSECMDEANEDAYEVVPVMCFACAARDAEQRSVAERLDTAEHRRSGGIDRSAVDGTYLAVVRKGGE